MAECRAVLRSWLPRGPDGAACGCAAERAGEAGKYQEIEVVRVVAHDLATFETCERRAGEIFIDANNFVYCAQSRWRQVNLA